MENLNIDHEKFFMLLKNIENNHSVEDSCNTYSVNEEDFLEWRKKYNDLETYQGEMLCSFFKNIDDYLKKYEIFSVNKDINLTKNGSYIYDNNKCSKWFYNKVGQPKTEMFGSYFDFGNSNYLLHIEVGTFHLHIGIVRYKLIDGKYETVKMNNKDFNHVLKKFGKDLPQSSKLEKRGWGNVWCSIDCGNFTDLAKKETIDAISDFQNSQLCKEKVTPMLNRIDDIKNNRNNAFFYAPSFLNFRVSYKCNLQCKHCYNSSSSKEEDHIDRDAALRVISEAYDCGLRTLGVTGGEPMLFPGLIVDMMSLATKLGYKKINMVTNAYWGKSLDHARKILQKLYDVGFKPPVCHLSISAGEFHHEFLEWSHHQNVVTAHHQIMGTTVRVDFEHAPGNSHLVDEFKNYLQDNGVEDDWYKLGVRTSLASVGRWKENQEAYSSPLIPVEDLVSCEPVGWFTVDPNGDVFPCCGFNRNIGGLVLGNINKSSVSEIIESTKTHIPLKYLYHMHLHEIHKKLKKHIDLPDKFTSVCEACEFFFKDKKKLECLH